MSIQSALRASPSPPAFSFPRDARSLRRGAASALVSKRADYSEPRTWRPQEWKRRRFAIDRLGGGFAATASSKSSTSSSSSAAQSSSSLAAAASAALARSLYPEIINDPFAALLAEAAGLKKKGKADDEIEQGGEAEAAAPTAPHRAAFAAAAAAFADATLLYATDLVNFETGDGKGAEYRQVVLLGPGLDSRPQRLGWPPGTVLFECASADAHAVAAAALASEGARQLAAEAAAAEEEEEEEEEKDQEEEFDDDDEEAGEEGGKRKEGGVFSAFNGSGAPRGRLLRRVVCDVSEESGREGLAEALFAAGFRAERLSVWCVSAGAFDDTVFNPEALGQLFGAVASCAAFCSFVVGDLPPMTRKEAESIIASSGLLGSVVAFGSEGDEAGSALWRQNGWQTAAAETEGKDGERQRWLFVGQQRSRSDAELGILRAFSEAAEDAEGFEDNVS